MSERLDGLKQRLGQLSDVGHAMSLAHWDQQTMMPPQGGEARAESLATLTRISHEMFVDDETGRLLGDATSELNASDPDGDDVRLITLVRRHGDKARRVPPDLAAEMARAASVGQEAWVVAREAGDFHSFAPYLEHNFELARRYVECHVDSGDFECAYDVLLDDYEPRLPTRDVSALFAELKAELVPVIAQIA